MNKKGISLLEVVCVIVLIGIITTVGGIAISSIIESSKVRTAENCSTDVLEAAQNYFASESIMVGDVTITELSNYLTVNSAKLNSTIIISRNENIYSLIDDTNETNIIKMKDYYVVYKNGFFKAYNSLDIAKENA